MVLHPRGLMHILRDRLASWSITVLTGSRQAGKTTLVRDLLPTDDQRPFLYFSLDDPDERLRLSADPVRRLDHENQLVILDEVQKQPELMDAVKFLADQRKNHRFLLLGSSQILLLKQVRETLAGRATLLELWPMALSERVEKEEVPPSGLDLIWEQGEVAFKKLADEIPSAENARLWRGKVEEHFLWGGYPGLEPLEEKDRTIWLRDFRRTYLERDLADLGRVADLDQFALAQNLLASRTAQLLSLSEISRELGVAVNTIKRYVRFLEISYQVFLLRPLLPTATARLVKSPKLYWTDPGLARVLSDRMSFSEGPLFETAVLDELLRWLSFQPDPPHIHFYRTHGGREVDFILYSPHGLLAIEAKASSKVHRMDTRALRDFLEEVRIPGLRQDAWRCGMIVYRGREIKPLAPNVWAIPDWRLFGPSL